ncbi:MAG TPA: sialidase family protein, partial [Ignavibacteriaceae bacterium]|nr:sialidase family protein [Ignavibacteriaceae bacterium]
MRNTIILFFIMTAYLFSQGWNNTVTTTINEPNLVKMDLFTNKDGNHIIVQNSNSTNSIKYYLLNSAGTVVRSSTIETSGNAEFPNISGDNDKVYLVYKLGSYLKAKKTTNAGANWTDINPSLSIGSNTCNGVDIVYSDGGLHVVYAMKDSDPNYETYYYKLNSSNSWVDYKNVTDFGNEVGGLSTITVSDNHVYVSYNTGDDDP